MLVREILTKSERLLMLTPSLCTGRIGWFNLHFRLADNGYLEMRTQRAIIAIVRLEHCQWQNFVL